MQKMQESERASMGELSVELNNEELKFLEILSDGKKKTFSDIILGFGRMLRHPPNKIAKPLLKLGLVEKAGLYRVTYRITDEGLAVLRTQRNKRG